MSAYETRSGHFALLVLAALIAAAVIVPYTLLRGIESFAGAFLFWTLFGVATIGVILVILSRWRV